MLKQTTKIRAIVIKVALKIFASNAVFYYSILEALSFDCNKSLVFVHSLP